MDRTRFDDLTRLMATGQNRRTVLRGLVGGAIAYAGVRQVSVAQNGTCVASGGTCVMEEGATPCCDSPCYSCFEGTCDYGGGRGTVDAGCTCETSEDCFESSCVESVCTAEEEICKELGDACEMVENHGCCGCLTCFEAQCDLPKGCLDAGCSCSDDFPCCDELTCQDGTCGTGEEVEDGVAETVTLPSTGTGTVDSSSTWAAVAVAGGAAVVAARVINQKNQSETNE